jgi:cobalt-zinc-cadmium efflux system outer membrane protein
MSVEVPKKAADAELQQVVFEQQDKSLPIKQRLFIPPGLPGADAPDITIPEDPKERERYFDKLYPSIPALPPLPPPAPGPEGRPMTLADLQRLAETYSPSIKTALAAVEAAKAAAYQAGMYPNPTIAWEHDTVETGPAGYPGGYFDQSIITGGKLTVQQAAATMDVLTARLNLRRARADLWTQVRSNYFAILVALQGIRYYEALFQFAEYLYEYQVKQVRVSKLGAGYEPMQLRPLVLQARFDIIQARNRYAAAWRQLAATLGLPDMPPSELAGSAAMPLPVFDYDNVVSRLVNHTDVRNALVSVQKAKYNLRSAKLVPLPDIGARALIQKDYTTPPNQVVHSAVMYLTVPLWNLNQGGIRQAEWQLAQTSAEPSKARLALINTLADAYNRYLVNRQQVDITMQQMRDLVQVYKSAWLRNQLTPQVVSFSDLWPIQVTLESYVTVFITALGAHFQATVDIADLLQTEDFFNSSQHQDIVRLPVLEDLMTPLRNYPRAPIAQGRGSPPSGHISAQGVVAPRSCSSTDAAPLAAGTNNGAQPQSPPQQTPVPSAPANPPAVLPQVMAVPRRVEGPAPEP